MTLIDTSYAIFQCDLCLGPCGYLKDIDKVMLYQVTDDFNCIQDDLSFKLIPHMTLIVTSYAIFQYDLCLGPFGYLKHIDKVMLYQATDEFIAFRMTSASN